MSGRVLVAGGTGPLGRAVVAELLDEGFAVAVHYRRDADGAAATVAAARADGRSAVAVGGDLLAESRRVVGEAAEALSGPLTAVVNCAWPAHGSAPVDAYDDDDLERSLDGVRVHLRLCRAALPQLRSTRGSVVFVSGALVHRRGPGLALYSLGKAAAESACRTLALEEGPHGVRVNVVAPGRVDIGAGDLAEEDAAFAALEQVSRLRRVLPLPTPADVARTVGLLLGPSSAALTGQVLAVAGGEPW
ncbi:SDR family oxidoreductase [Actinotalea sp. M2MS4P-6]|uniref:SDR family NAD(P)-dependent oxidoreductase n=1 Tax=Actinotalea sp. M2MS4P-6 TaxID=2983762 RepID=UPI0021E3767F|nr:SDR family oxidoreductase [Actinotalea sp. M2MS4P-6]MCV2394374.1 SDR family oxidoreductase [Actinotalea sp. M2MS4P-6]